MIARAVSLCLLSCAVLRGQEKAPTAVPVEEPDRPAEAPQAIPVEDAPVPEQPVPVVPGGNVPKAKVDESVYSKSRLFRVTGGEGATRASVALQLEQHKNDFEELIEDKVSKFKVPVNVYLTAEAGKQPVEYDLVETEDTSGAGVAGGSFGLGIRIHPDPGIDHDLLERAALTVLLYERSLRSVKPGELDAALVVRPWLVEGLVEAQKWKTGRADRRLYEGVFRRGGGFTMDELFELSDRSYQQLDGASRLSFRALSGALMMALLEQPQGKEAFRSFCGDAARYSGEMPVLLRKHFPDLNLSEKSLAKWWALTLAKLVQPTLTEVLPVLDTERELAAALQFHTRDVDGNALDRGLETWREILALKDVERAEAVRPADDGLVRLSYRCFPSYRPIILEYQQVLRDLVAGKDNKIEQRLVELSDQRAVRAQRATRARDYLDFFEISRARDLSGEFDDYMRLKKELELRPRPKRVDRLTDVLDTMQKAYEPKVKR